jgi:ppGpp synthetase/RelA/SpoT-type nucleotidyltranferase
MTKSQIDRLGERLKTGAFDDTDLRLLDEYRRSFADAYAVVVKVLRDGLAVEPTGRPAKSTLSIVDKLRRESIRLSQIQDIAGCRIIVDDIHGQERMIARLPLIFEHLSLSDRRRKPSHGYRAVHAIVKRTAESIEIQIRTALQQLWAEYSEKLSDVIDPMIKYGGGPVETRVMLSEMSDMIAQIESLDLNAAVGQREVLARAKREFTNFLAEAIRSLKSGEK